MANERRQTENYKSGSLTPGNSLTPSATAMVSSTLAQMAAVDSTAHQVLVLDPLGTGNGPEVVYVTAHTAASTGATIVRGREGSSGVSHTSTTAWVHAFTVADAIQRIAASANRPSTGGLPFEGQILYQMDTNSYYAYDGTTWQQLANIGAWTDYTPTLTASGGGATLGNGVNTGRYTQVGRIVHWEMSLKLGTTTSFGSGILYVALPVAAAQISSQERRIVGNGTIVDAGSTNYFASAEVRFAETTALKAVVATTGGDVSGTATIPMIWATGDFLLLSGSYEAAS